MVFEGNNGHSLHSLWVFPSPLVLAGSGWDDWLAARMQCWLPPAVATGWLLACSASSLEPAAQLAACGVVAGQDSHNGVDTRAAEGVAAEAA